MSTAAIEAAVQEAITVIRWGQSIDRIVPTAVIAKSLERACEQTESDR